MGGKKNRSATYILPLVLENISVNKKAIVNTWIYNTDELDLNQHNVKGLFIKLLYSEESKDTFKFDPRCKVIIDIDSKHFMVYFEAKLDCFTDISLLIDGRYSKIREASKKLILEFYGLKSGPIKSILEKNPEYRIEMMASLDAFIEKDAELGSVFDLKTEVYE